MSSDIQPFRIAATDSQLDDLKRRLRETRWPERECVDDWSQGLPLVYAQEVAAYWLEKYDWRAREARLNRFAQFKTTIDGLGIHFVHVRSPHADALPRRRHPRRDDGLGLGLPSPAPLPAAACGRGP